MKFNNLSSDDKIQVCLTAKEWDLLIEDTFIDSDLTDSWARPDAKLRTTPYSEEELDRLAEGTIASIDDLEAWKNLVAMVGIKDATQTIRMALQSQQSVNVKPGH